MPEYHFDKVTVLLSKKDIPAQVFLCESYKNVHKIFFLLSVPGVQQLVSVYAYNYWA